MIAMKTNVGISTPVGDAGELPLPLLSPQSHRAHRELHNTTTCDNWGYNARRRVRRATPLEKQKGGGASAPPPQEPAGTDASLTSPPPSASPSHPATTSAG